MITTAVQQASQMVEVQGASATTEAAGDAFSVTFAASVNDSAARVTAQSGGDKVSYVAAAAGQSAAKPVFAPGLLVKGVSLKTNGLQSSSKVEELGMDGSLLEQVTEPASSSVEASSDLVLKNKMMSSPAVEDPIAGVDSRSAVLTRVADETPVKTADTGAKSLPERVAVTGLAASAELPRDGELSKSTDRVVVSGRRGDVTSASKEIVHTATPVTVHDPAVLGPASSLVASPTMSLMQLDSTTRPRVDGPSIAQQESRPGVLTSVLQASDDAESISGSVASGSVDDARTLSSAVTGQDEIASLQKGVPSNSAVASNLNGTGGPNRGVSQDGIESKGNVARFETTSDHIDTDSSVRAFGPAEPTFAAQDISVATGVPLTSESAATQAQSLFNVKGVQAKATASSTGAKTVMQSNTSKVYNAAPDSNARADGTHPEKRSALNAADEKQVSGNLVSTQVGLEIPQQLDGVRDVTSAVALLRGAVAKAPSAATKDEKAKRIADAGGDPAARSATAPTVLGDSSGNTTNSPVAVSSGATRVIAVADAVVPITQGATHTVGSSIQPAGIGTTPTVTARPQGWLSAGPLTEATSTAVQSSESHRTLVATPTTLEVGVQSGTQGWLRIRAEVGDQGTVNASLAAGSSSGRELLHSQIPALNAFLHSEQMAVTTTVVERGASLTGGQGNAASGGLSGHDGQDRQDGQGNSNGVLSQGGGAHANGDQSEMARHAPNANEMRERYDSRGSVTSVAGLVAGGTGASGESGRWLNVRV